MTALLVVLAIAFAFSMGAHYTGATFASHGVEHTVGHNLLTGDGLSVPGLVVVIGVTFALTSVFNVARIPTSTIGILVFTVVGTGLAASALADRPYRGRPHVARQIRLKRRGIPKDLALR